MRKKDQHFAKINEYAERFRKEPTEVLQKRLRSGSLHKEAAIAIKRVLAERLEQTDDALEQDA